MNIHEHYLYIIFDDHNAVSGMEIEVCRVEAIGAGTRGSKDHCRVSSAIPLSILHMHHRFLYSNHFHTTPEATE